MMNATQITKHTFEKIALEGEFFERLPWLCLNREKF